MDMYGSPYGYGDYRSTSPHRSSSPHLNSHPALIRSTPPLRARPDMSPRSPYPGSPGYPNPGAPIHHVPNHAVPVHMVRASPPPQLVRATPPPPPVIQEKVVEKPVYVEVEKVVEKPVLVPVERPVEKIVEVDREIPITKYVEIPVDKIIERFVEVPVEKIVTIEKAVEVPVEKIVTVERLVEKELPRCDACGHVLDHRDDKCSTCPLVQRLKQPQAPVIVCQDCRYNKGTHEWVASSSQTATITVGHAQKDGWQHDCPVVLYVTCDGTDPAKNNYAFTGAPPLAFRISKSLTVRAVAINEKVGSSIVVAESFLRLEPCGVGMLLKKMNGYKGIYVQEVLVGGSAWLDGNIQQGDEVKMIDDVCIENMDLKDIHRLILGQSGSEIRLKILREDRDENGNNIDEVGAEFCIRLERSPGVQNPSYSMRKEPLPFHRLEGFRQVSVEYSGERSTWTQGKLLGPASTGSFKSITSPEATMNNSGFANAFPF